MHITPEFINFALVGVFVILIAGPIALFVLRLFIPSVGDVAGGVRLFVADQRDRNSPLRDALLVQNLQDPTTFTLYDSIYYPDDK